MKPIENTFALPASDGQQVRGVYRDTGEGPVGVFLHGLLSDADGTKSMQLWERAGELNRSWIRFDMRAHGKSDGDFTEFTISRAIEDTKLVLSQFEDRPKLLVGSSMGGWVSSLVALEQELNICGTILIAPAFNFMQQIYLGCGVEEQMKWRKSGFKTFESPHMESDFTLSYAAVEDSRQHDVFKLPMTYNHPLKIFHGRLDDVVPSTQSQFFKVRVGSLLEVTIIPEGDHRLTDHMDLIEDAIDEIWPSAASEEDAT